MPWYKVTLPDRDTIDSEALRHEYIIAWTLAGTPSDAAMLRRGPLTNVFYFSPGAASSPWIKSRFDVAASGIGFSCERFESWAGTARLSEKPPFRLV